MLYEMLTGRRAFQEDSAVATLAAILHNDPAPPASPAVPRALLRILFKCLQKKPEDRWQDIGDVKLLLEDVAKDSEAPADAQSNPQTPNASRARRFGWPAVAAAGALLAYFIPRFWSGAGPYRTPTSAVLRMLTADGGLSGYPAISRDGKFVAFASDRAKENNLDLRFIAGSGMGGRITKDDALAFLERSAYGNQASLFTSSGSAARVSSRTLRLGRLSKPAPGKRRWIGLGVTPTPASTGRRNDSTSAPNVAPPKGWPPNSC